MEMDGRMHRDWRQIESACLLLPFPGLFEEGGKGKSIGLQETEQTRAMA